jgi:hypothetical protein
MLARLYFTEGHPERVEVALAQAQQAWLQTLVIVGGLGDRGQLKGEFPERNAHGINLRSRCARVAPRSATPARQARLRLKQPDHGRRGNR